MVRKARSVVRRGPGGVCGVVEYVSQPCLDEQAAFRRVVLRSGHVVRVGAVPLLVGDDPDHRGRQPDNGPVLCRGMDRTVVDGDALPLQCRDAPGEAPVVRRYDQLGAAFQKGLQAAGEPFAVLLVEQVLGIVQDE